MFILKRNTNMISREVFNAYWLIKYPKLGKDILKEMKLDNHCEDLAKFIQGNINPQKLLDNID